MNNCVLDLPEQTEIKEGVFTLARPYWDEINKEWHVLCNVMGSLAICAVNLSITQNEKKYNLVCANRE